jgi:hypothetical protein
MMQENEREGGKRGERGRGNRYELEGGMREQRECVINKIAT